MQTKIRAVPELESAAPVDEQALVDQARGNDMSAYEQLYRLHSARIYGLCYRLCNDREQAEDLTQEAFVMAWRKLDNFRGESAFGSWLYRIATNLALTHLRGRKPEFSGQDDGLFEREDALGADLDLQLSLESALAKLPYGARIVFVLYSIEGFSHKEISQELRIAVGSSKAQLFRAKQLLQGYLANGNA